MTDVPAGVPLRIEAILRGGYRWCPHCDQWALPPGWDASRCGWCLRARAGECGSSCPTHGGQRSRR